MGSLIALLVLVLALLTILFGLEPRLEHYELILIALLAAALLLGSGGDLWDRIRRRQPPNS